MLVRAIKFDDMTNRKERSKLDNLAPIISTFESFIEKCHSSYIPSQYVTIDEMLDAFRGAYRFGQYIANKPAN